MYLRGFERGLDLTVEALHHCRRCFGRRGHCIPGCHVEALQPTLRHGGHVGQGGRTLFPHHSQCAQGPGVDLRHHRTQDFHRRINLPAAQSRDHGGCAVEGHHLHIHPGAGLEQLCRQVLRAAHIDGAHIQLARVGPGIGQQFTQCFETGVVRHHDGEVKKPQGGHRRKVLGSVKRQRLEQPCTHCRAVGHQQQCVAIRRSLGHRIPGHHTACTGFVVDHHTLAQAFRHFLHHGAGRQISNSPRTKRHHQPDRFGRVGLGRCRQGQAACHATHDGRDEKMALGVHHRSLGNLG